MTSKVHRVRYYNPKPQPVNCAALNKTSHHLAIARGDASIEIWDVKFAPHPIKFIPGVENGSIEALCWVNERLLSTGLGGALVEWDLDTLTLKTSTLLTGYAAWCLDATRDYTLVAVGTEQGYVNLFDVEYSQITYKKLFDKQEGRILCCKFNNTGKYLATGSLNSIRVWNVQSGQAISRMSVTFMKKEIVVWCLGFLSDNVVVSGDSVGRLTFWDGFVGDQIESYTTHKADITSVVVSDDEEDIYCAGVDPLIVRFTKVHKDTNQDSKSDKPSSQWARNVQMNIHEHDVRVLITNGNQLISAGISGYLVFSSYPPRWIMRVPPMIVPSRTSVCADKKLLFLRYSSHIEVWKLGTYATNKKGEAIKSNFKDESNQKDTENVELDSTDVIYKKANLNKNVALKITEKPLKLVSIKTKKKKQIQCCEMSPNGEFIFYSTDSDVRMLKLESVQEDNQSNIFLSRLSVCEIKPPCDRVCFSADSKYMAANCPGNIQLLEVHPSVGATLVQTINTDKYLKSKTLLHLTISGKTPSGTYLIAADTSGGVCVWSLLDKKFKHYVTLPTYFCVPSALYVDVEQDTLYMVYVDQKIVEYKLGAKKFMEWPDQILPAEWRARAAAVHSVSTHPQRNALVFQDQNSFWVIEKEYNNDAAAPTKITKQQNANSMQLPFNIIPIKYLAGFHWLEKDEALTIELLPGNILDQLPAIVMHKRH